MKRLFFAIIALLCFSQTVEAQEYEYVPFVREGVQWVSYFDNRLNDGC